MATREDYPYKPDYAVLPGESLVEVLESLSMTQAGLANRMGRPMKTINEIIKGKAAITADTALQLERVLGVPASFWIHLERNYREALARKKDQERLKKQLKWLRQFPVRAMAKSGWIRAKGGVEQLQELLRFFGVASPEQWRDVWSRAGVAYRRSRVFESDPGAVAAWLRQGEVQAQGIQCAPYEPNRFRKLLGEIRVLTLQPPDVFQAELVRLCAESGVAVVFVPEFPKLRISGAARWLSPRKALIQLSLRYKTNDHLWFSFFHEAGHILLHGKRSVFIDDGTGSDSKEAKANAFAADLLVPPATYDRLRVTSPLTETAVLRASKEVGVAPGIIVGRLQHDGLLGDDQMNRLKERFAWVPIKSEEAAA
jgi:HTH-type transcriptional regulator/antitoxin HigA